MSISNENKSLFSVKLGQYIRDSGISVKSIAEQCGLERTSIHKVINNGRMPDRDFVEKIADFLEVIPGEKMDLFNYFDILDLGEDAFVARKSVQDMIEKLSRFNISIESDMDIFKSSSSFNYSKTVYNSNYSVNTLVWGVLSEELKKPRPKIDVSVPTIYKWLFDVLYNALLREPSNITLRHILRFNTSQNSLISNFNNNLELLYRVIEFSFAPFDNYECHYYYQNSKSTDDPTVFFPYFLCTSTKVLHISEEFDSAFLLDTADGVSYFKNSFDKIYSKMPTLLEYKNISDYSDFIQTVSLLYVIQCRPLFLDIILPKKSNTQSVDFTRKYIKKNKSPSMVIFSIDGLEQFMRDGEVELLGSKIYTAETIEERKAMIQSIYDSINLEEKKYFIIDPIFFNFPSNISISCINNKYVQLILSSAATNGKLVSLSDRGIVASFTDFFNSMKLPYVYNKTKSLDILLRAIQKV